MSESEAMSFLTDMAAEHASPQAHGQRRSGGGGLGERSLRDAEFSFWKRLMKQAKYIQYDSAE